MSDEINQVPEASPGDDINQIPEASPGERRVLARARWVEITFAGALCLYAILAVLANQYAYFGWDISIGRAIQSIDISGFRGLMVGISALGTGWLAWALVIAAGLILIVARYRLEGIICMVEVALGSWINTLSKAAIGRPRPAEPLVAVTTIVTHESFPSGHVTYFVDFFGFLLVLTYVLTKPGPLRRVLYVILWPLVTLIGVSRVYLGAHWPSDVVGAYLAGGCWLMLTMQVYRWIKLRSVRESHTAN
jgi:undecaprenyl-diphosphatase